MAKGSKRKRQNKADESVDSESETQDHGVTTLLDPPKSKKARKVVADSDLCLVGTPIAADEARQRWPQRYQSKVKKQAVTVTSNDEGNEVLQAKNHYTEAMVDGCLYKLGDNAYVKAEDGSPDYIARIVEFFETVDREPYFKAQWFYRAEDTVINKENAHLIDKRRVFLSDIQDDNPLNCIVSKVEIAEVAPDIDLAAKEGKIPESGLYYNMKYSLQHLTFKNIFTEISEKDSGTSSVVSSECGSDNTSSEAQKFDNSQKYLLDLYSGCGAMSTGLCMGASIAGIKLVTRWAVDINSFACKSLQWNHPETKVRNEAAEDFLCLLKEWEKLCQKFSLLDANKPSEDICSEAVEEEECDGQGCEEEKEKEGQDDGGSEDSEDFEVERLLDICFGDPNKIKKRGLYFKVRWKGYDKSYDTWEPIDGLSNCQEKLEEFVRKGHKSNILPLPGSVYFICGGPPCQGVSGFNRFRNSNAPLEDEKNKQLIVYMDTIEHLKPRYVLMENVVDILKFAKGFLGRYAVGRLVSMNYQARMGMMAAGNYGVPQFRMRVFLWGSHPSEKLPPYPLPTHEVFSRQGVPNEFEEIHVAYDKKDPCQLKGALTLGDAISDLPQVNNDESQDQRNYGTKARTEFQKNIRLQRKDVIYLTVDSRHAPSSGMLYDHQPLQLNADDLERVCQIPKKKGANFRDLSGVVVGENNRVEWDTTMDRVLIKSGKPLVPDYCMTFVKGRSTKPFGRLWMDEIVNTVVTRAEPHKQNVIHPSQDRVLTIRENARLQGFPDCYKLFGTIKERYIQVGNAVAVPVATALGYAFGLACQNLCDDEPLVTLPFEFPDCLARSSQIQGDDGSD
ncbi:DNA METHYLTRANSFERASE 4, chromomethylase 1 [Hibiscus trionum]|uniref:DNA (cytosine-5-)-methyltransferase n=1 Tax=Hibiscus trionum TaxID=183268 RepID=A0A9W7I2V4_HIBTR|nr:DNA METHYLTRANSFERASE 4, chromomethylase 1 [Hibiscus trionum]